MREENKRIYVIISFFNESLSYDFNLSVGDTVPNPALGPSNEDARIIDAIDEIEINGTIRQQFHLSGGAYIIEGIGASTGLFSRVSEENGCSSEMTCYQEEGTTFHFNSDCDFYLNVEEELAPALERELIKIVNLQGQEVEPQPNQILIYLYSDGSAEKKVYIE
ncbi:hypothetical protein [Sanyastnella coralliicola]|uniref:hypothetical protein n=1 Tax=Sanyastnella coralliicola TaxID=3069118 RepID=UPI0027B9167D|nr:hypothetical protein [Longitalea sp. SCSIO 12813]